VDQWNLAKALDFYKARFADASNFTFVFVGSFTPETIKPLVETYIASLPATHSKETWRDLGLVPPSDIVVRTVQKGIAPKSNVAIIFSGPIEYDDAHKLAFRTMTLLLQSRLLDSIRQELGGTYSITATPRTAKYPKPEYRIRIDWTCDPARAATLIKRVFEEINAVKAAAYSPNQMSLIRQGLLREFEQDSQDNGYLLNEIARRYENGDAADVAAVEDMPRRIAALTGDQIQRAAQTYLDTTKYVQVMLMPETK